MRCGLKAVAECSFPPPDQEGKHIFCTTLIFLSRAQVVEAMRVPLNP